MIRLRMICFCMGMACLSAFAQGGDEPPLYDGLRTGEFMKRWLLTEPFPMGLVDSLTGEMGNAPDVRWKKEQVFFDLDLLQDQGGEVELRPHAGMTHQIGNASSQWIVFESDDDRIDLDDPFDRHEYAIVYAYAEVEVEDATTALLGVGSDDMAKVWLNGELIYEHRGGRENRIDSDYVEVEMKEGVNRLMFKVFNQQMNWGFVCRFLDRSRIDKFRLLEMELEGMPGESVRSLAIIVGGVLTATLILLAALLYLSRQGRSF